jgi:hypothetical protein
MDWSADGRFILYDNLDPTSGLDVWALPDIAFCEASAIRTTINRSAIPTVPGSRRNSRMTTKMSR